MVIELIIKTAQCPVSVVIFLVLNENIGRFLGSTTQLHICLLAVNAAQQLGKTNTASHSNVFFPLRISLQV